MLVLTRKVGSYLRLFPEIIEPVLNKSILSDENIFPPFWGEVHFKIAAVLSANVYRVVIASPGRLSIRASVYHSNKYSRRRVKDFWGHISSTGYLALTFNMGEAVYLSSVIPNSDALEYDPTEIMIKLTEHTNRSTVRVNIEASKSVRVVRAEIMDQKTPLSNHLSASLKDEIT